MARISTCSVCGDGGRTVQMTAVADSRDDVPGADKTDTCVGKTVDVCEPNSVDRPGSERCMATVIEKNPTVKWKGQHNTARAERWSF